MKKIRTSSPIPNRTKNKDRCPHPGCNQVGNYCRGFCVTHYRIFRQHCITNGSWSSKDDRAEAQFRLTHPGLFLPPWEYEGNEASLIALQEQKEAQEMEAALKFAEDGI